MTSAETNGISGADMTDRFVNKERGKQVSKPMFTDWCKFTQWAITQYDTGHHSRIHYTVYGDPHPHCGLSKAWCEISRHIRNSAINIIRQISRDGSMNNRVFNVYQTDFNKLTTKHIFQGRYHAACKKCGH